MHSPDVMEDSLLVAFSSSKDGYGPNANVLTKALHYILELSHFDFTWSL